MEKKIVGISPWYFLFTAIKTIVIFLASALAGIVVYAKFTNTGPLTFFVGTTVGLIASIIFVIGEILYQSRSGIFVNDSGDHIVRWGGWTLTEDRLLKGTIISNQTRQGPLDQLLGMATITTGVLGHRILYGAKIKDIKTYDELMNNDTKFSTASIV